MLPKLVGFVVCRVLATSVATASVDPKGLRDRFNECGLTRPILAYEEGQRLFKVQPNLGDCPHGGYGKRPASSVPVAEDLYLVDKHVLRLEIGCHSRIASTI